MECELKVQPRVRTALISLNTAVVLFGVSGLFAKFVASSPMMIVFGRTTVAAVALALIAIARGTSWVRSLKNHWPGLIFSGILLTLHWAAFFTSIRVSTVAVGLMTYSTFPMFVTLLEPIVFRERLRGVDVLTSVIVLVGLVVMVPRFAWGDRTLQGTYWGLVSGATFAGLAVMNRGLARDVSPLVLAAGQNAVAALVTFPFVLRPGPVPSPHDILCLLLLGLFCTALAHVLFISSLEIIKAQLASVIAGMEAIYGVIFALIFLGEVPTPRTIIGGGVILGATAMAVVWRKC